eukprot:jgi/Mesen1/7319/ME000376S06482
MPYSLTIKPPERWDGDDYEAASHRSRYSYSGDFEHRRSGTFPRGASFSGDDAGGMGDRTSPSPSVALTPSLSSSRVERLLRERQLRRSGSCFQFGDPEVPDGRSESIRGDSRNSSYNDIVGSEKGLTTPITPSPQRLIVVANRLPVSAVGKPDGSWNLELSAGGLVSALLGVKQNFETCWIGWPGLSVKGDASKKALSVALALKGCVPVYLDEETVDQYYNGYCNNVLWPLFHYLGLPQEDRLAATRSMQSQYTAYKKANEMFAEVVLSQYQEGDVVWCHDYHLMLLPAFLKERHAAMKVGWFLHTPFPSSEIYRTLPLRGEILNAALAADLIGFHTYDYARHFVSACTRILGLEGTPEGVEDQGKLTRVAAFPIGIDPDRFINALETDIVKNHIDELKARFAGRKVMLGVDRLDMIKGIPQKLLAFEKFLDENAQWRDKVLLVQIAVPSRTDVPEYQRLTSQVHEIVGRINGRYGTLTTVPIHHLDRSLAFNELCALYAITDIALVTSLRDGMNLVSYEFVACQNHKKGVLILSEFAGAAQSLGAGAILVNPWNISDMAGAIEDALGMSEAERTERHRHNFEHVELAAAAAAAAASIVLKEGGGEGGPRMRAETTHVCCWPGVGVGARGTRSELNDTVVEAELRTLRIPPQLPVHKAIEAFRDSTNRLLILGYNSTMTATAHMEAPRRRAPDQIKEMKLRMHPGMSEILHLLCSAPNTTVVILSGSERAVLDETFSEYDVWLAAENGMFLRHTRGDWMTTMPEHLNMEWVESVQLVFDYFCERTPRSYVEARETSLVWNYKFADVEFGRVQARDMLQHLWTGPISNSAVDVVQGGKSVEVRPVGVSKGAAIERILGEIVHQKPITTPIDYVLCCGHFLAKDEDIYTFFEPELPFDRDDGPSLRGPGYDNDRSIRGGGSGPRLLERALMGKGKHLDHHHHHHHRGLRHNKSAAAAAGASGGFPPLSPERTSSLASAFSRHHSPRGERERGNERASEQERPTSIDSDDSLRSGELMSVLDLNSDHYFSCAVGRKRSQARYSLASSEDVIAVLKAIAASFPRPLPIWSRDKALGR